MTKKQIKGLVQKSYIKGKLDAKIVSTVAGKLSRKDLKAYIYELRTEENKKYVTITSVNLLKSQEKKEFQEMFPGKELVYETDPDLIAGVKVRTHDTEYELSINNIINSITSHLKQLWLTTIQLLKI